MRSIFVRTVFLTRRSAAILRPRIRRPHIVARLTSPIVGGFARHRTIHIPILRTVHLPRIVLRASHLAVHCTIVHAIIHATVRAIVHTTIYPVIHSAICTVVHPMLGYRSGCDLIVSAELSGT